MSRYMKIDGKVDGEEKVLDRSTHKLEPARHFCFDKFGKVMRSYTADELMTRKQKLSGDSLDAEFERVFGELEKDLGTVRPTKRRAFTAGSWNRETESWEGGEEIHSAKFAEGSTAGFWDREKKIWVGDVSEASGKSGLSAGSYNRATKKWRI